MDQTVTKLSTTQSLKMSSRIKVNFGPCGNNMERRHLQDHTARFHQGPVMLEKVAFSQPICKVVKESALKRVHTVENENDK